MDETTRKRLNVERLRLIDPTIRQNVKAVLADLERKGLRPVIHSEVWRSPAEQLEKFKKGLSQVRWGFHCATTKTGKPDSLAADIVDANKAWNVNRDWWLHVGAAAQRRGLNWGGYFGLNKNLRGGLRDVLERKQFQANPKIGWDPAHVETARVTIAQAKAGKR